MMVLNLDPEAYRDMPEDSPQTPMRHLRTKDNSPILKRHYEMGLLAQHSSKSQEHYTPANIVSKIREVLGSIACDPASSWLAQKTIQADWWYGLTTEDPHNQPGRWLGADGLAAPWHGTVFLNPPGGHTGLVRPELSEISRSYPVVWWLKLCSDYVSGNVTSAIYMGFSLEQMVTTQRGGTPCLLDFPFCVPKSRLCFDYPMDTNDGRPIDSTSVVAGKQPTHGNVIVYLPPKEPHEAADGVDRFASVFASVGKVVIT
jgi:hypothetical protein